MKNFSSCVRNSASIFKNSVPRHSNTLYIRSYAKQVLRKVVILKDHLPNNLFAGDVVEVKPGFMRNFLYPKRIADYATLTNLAKNEKRLKEDPQLAYRLAQLKEGAEMRKRLQTLPKLSFVRDPVTIKHDGFDYNVAQPVVKEDIVKKLSEYDVHVKSDHIFMSKPIDKIGTYRVPIRTSELSYHYITITLHTPQYEDHLRRELNLTPQIEIPPIILYKQKLDEIQEQEKKNPTKLSKDEKEIEKLMNMSEEEFRKWERKMEKKKRKGKLRQKIEEEIEKLEEKIEDIKEAEIAAAVAESSEKLEPMGSSLGPEAPGTAKINLKEFKDEQSEILAMKEEPKMATKGKEVETPIVEPEQPAEEVSKKKGKKKSKKK